MGRYVPPELEGIQSFNQASGKKPNNRKADGSQVVRFECPFAIWCTHCDPEQIIGQGVRFNAEKRKVGNYYSTPVWAFRIKHTVCGGWIEVRTDPKNAEYVVTEGGRRRDAGENKLLEGEFLIGAKKIEGKDGAFGALEKNIEDKEVANTQQVRVKELQKRQERDWANPYEMNQRIRKDFRVGRRQRQKDANTGEALQEKYGLGLDLTAPSSEDSRRAKLIDFEPSHKHSHITQGIFEQPDGLEKTKSIANTQRRSLLYASLRSNTRAKADPFTEDRQVRADYSKTNLIPGRDGTSTKIKTYKAEDIGNGPATTLKLAAYDSD